MTIETAFETFALPGGSVRAYVARPRAPLVAPALVAFTDIFALTASTCRTLDRLAGYGYAVVAPEIYHRRLPAGTAFAFDDAGREAGLAAARATPVADFDATARELVAALRDDPRFDPARTGAVGWCLGGHLAFRAARLPLVRATVCFYPTGLANGALGADADAGSLQRAAHIGGALLTVFGLHDPHVPASDRAAIRSALEAVVATYAYREYDAEHAFMRDEGPRYDPQATDAALADAVAFFGRYLRA